MTPISAAILVFACGMGTSTFEDEPVPGKLSMTPAVACAKINGYDDYEPLDEPIRTRDDKLLVYFEPGGHGYELVDKEYRVHLVEDARIRRRGEKKVLLAKDKFLEYQGKSKVPPLNLYLSNSISLKPLPPGEYDLEIILRDEIDKGPPVSQIFSFRVRATGEKPPAP